MIKLIQTLSNCDKSFFSGWILAHAKILLQDKAIHYNNNLINATKQRASFLVTGTDKNNAVQQSLKVLLLLPKTKANTISQKTEKIGSYLFKQKFSTAQINDYINLSGDKNIIHQGENPIVPGLMMVLYLYEKFKDQTKWDIRFLYPVHADEKVFFYQQDTTINAYVNDVLVFTIKFK